MEVSENYQIKLILTHFKGDSYPLIFGNKDSIFVIHKLRKFSNEISADNHELILLDNHNTPD